MTSATVAADDAEPQGSWLPLLLVALLLSIRWLYSGQGNVPVRIRRWANLQKVQWRKRLGWRDESVYRSGAAGQGASKRVKRQG